MTSDAPEEEDASSEWFGEYANRLVAGSIVDGPRADGGAHACPCCHYLTLGERGAFEICPVCFWEDDGQDDHDAAVVRGGPNGSLSLSKARANFEAFGACDERAREHVRKPKPDEIPR